MVVLDMVDKPHRAYQRQVEAFVRGSIQGFIGITRTAGASCG